MKKLFIVSILVLIFGVGCGSNRTPEALLKRILQLSLKKDYKSIEKLFYPLGGYPNNLTTWDGFLEILKEQRIDYTGDFSYSDKAMAILIQKSANKFKRMFGANDCYDQDDFLRSHPGENFVEYSEGVVSVVLVKINNEYKLLYCGGMNCLLEKNTAK